MKNKYRTIYCGEVTTANIGEEIRVAGWLLSGPTVSIFLYTICHS